MFLTRITFIVLVGVFLFQELSYGQISQGGKPLEFLTLKSAKIPLVDLPQQNNEVLSKHALNEMNVSAKLKPFRFAEPINVNYSILNSGVWTNAYDGTQIWRLKIRSKGAKSLNLIFDNFKLPENARLFLFNENENYILGAFTSVNNKLSGKFSVMPVLGDEITIQYEIPSGAKQNVDFEIIRVNHDFVGVLKDNDRRPFYPTVAGSCNVDINCELGENWSEIKDAVCRLVVNGVEFCTGTLVNNTAEDKKPYIISAAHCYDEWNYAETTIFAFNYESPYCAPLDGDPSNSISGAIMKAQFDSLDFALVEMSLVPPPEYRPFYAGWDNSGVLTDTAISIHHPWGDVKKIAIDYDIQKIDDFNTHYTKNGFIEIARWDAGVTENGSSGGALFNREQKVIGTLTGGVATCANPVFDYFERLDLSWDYRSETTKQLKTWLDPLNSGVQELDGKRFYTGTDLCQAFTNLTGDDQHQLIELISDSNVEGFWGGTNSVGITEFVEKFSIEGDENLQGISMGIGKLIDSQNGGEITIKVYNGNNLPETLIYSQNYELDFMVEDAMNYFGFDESVETGESFFIGFELSNLNSLDSFAVYQSVREAGQENFFYYKRGSLWYNFALTNIDNYAVSNVFELVACNVNSISTANDTQRVNSPLEIIVYPNPVSDIFTFETGREISLNKISVFNLLGQQVQVNFSNLQNKKVQIDLSGNLPGVYFVRYNNGINIATKKISYVPW